MSIKYSSPNLLPPADLEFVRQEGNVSIMQIGETVVRMVGEHAPGALERGSVAPSIHELGPAVQEQFRQYLQDLRAENVT